MGQNALFYAPGESLGQILADLGQFEGLQLNLILRERALRTDAKRNVGCRTFSRSAVRRVRDRDSGVAAAKVSQLGIDGVEFLSKGLRNL